MNTREREVMDALYRFASHAGKCYALLGLDGVPCNCGLIEARVAYNALLAEGSASNTPRGLDHAAMDEELASLGTRTDPPGGGSASSEGAEAVYQVRPNCYMSDIAPWREVSKAEFDGKDGAYPRAAYDHRILYTRPQPAQGAHEQRSCEGSERRRSAIEDAFYEAQGDIFTTETPWGEVSAWIAARAKGQRGMPELRPIADEVVERVLHAADGSCHEFAQVKAVLEALPRSLPIADEVLDAAVKIYHFAPGEAKHREQLRAVLEWYESTLPRGLPAGSDAQLKVIDEVIRLLESPAVMPSPLGGINYAPEHYFGLLHDFKRVRTELATAEQPSCGQDAR